MGYTPYCTLSSTSFYLISIALARQSIVREDVLETEAKQPVVETTATGAENDATSNIPMEGAPKWLQKLPTDGAQRQLILEASQKKRLHTTAILSAEGGARIRGSNTSMTAATGKTGLEYWIINNSTRTSLTKPRHL